MVVKGSLVLLGALLIRWSSDFPGIEVAGRSWERGAVWVGLPQAEQSCESPGPGAHAAFVSGGSVEVYNCATGSADCSQCLGREDLGHRCLWSESSSSCRLQTEPPQVPEVCPPPEIRKVRPEGSTEGARSVAWREVAGGAKGWERLCCAAWSRGGSAHCPWHGMGSRPALNYSLTFCAVKDISLVTGSSLHHVRGKNNSSAIMASPLSSRSTGMLPSPVLCPLTAMGAAAVR